MRILRGFLRAVPTSRLYPSIFLNSSSAVFGNLFGKLLSGISTPPFVRVRIVSSCRQRVNVVGGDFGRFASTRWTAFRGRGV